MVETDPVTGLVRESMAKVVVGSGASWDRREEHDDTIIFGGAAVGRRESSIAEEAGTRTRLEPIEEVLDDITNMLSKNVFHEPDGVDIESIRTTSP